MLHNYIIDFHNFAIILLIWKKITLDIEVIFFVVQNTKLTKVLDTVVHMSSICGEN